MLRGHQQSSLAQNQVSFEADMEGCNFSQKGSYPVGRPLGLYKPGIMRSLGHPQLAGGCANLSYSKCIRAERHAGLQPTISPNIFTAIDLKLHTPSLDHRGSLSGGISAMTPPDALRLASEFKNPTRFCIRHDGTTRRILFRQLTQYEPTHSPLATTKPRDPSYVVFSIQL